MIDYPAITCLCPTYGRFARLRESLACFLAQDYLGEKRLLILNDARAGIWIEPDLSHEGVTVINESPPSANLGEKRQYLLERATTPLVAHWDDDDLYLPWHLSRSVAALLTHPVARCVKSRGAWYLIGQREALQNRGVHHNVFEGTMAFYREDALALGGYPPKHSGQAKHLMDMFERAGVLYKIPDVDEEGSPQFCQTVSTQSGQASSEHCDVSYAYRWYDGVGHISSIGNKPASLQSFHALNQDFGDGQPLTPGDVTPYWRALRYLPVLAKGSAP